MSDEHRVTDIDDASVRRFATLADDVTAEDRRRVAPPADLWDAIAAATQADEDATVGPVPDSRQRHITVASPVDEPTPVAGSPVGADAVVLPLHRRLSTIVVSAAAAVVLVLGVVVLAVSGSDDEPAGELIATGTLEALADGFEGGVELVDVDGRLRLDVELGDLPDTSAAYYELWLIKDLDTGEMQSLGPIDGSGRIDLPRGLDPALYATVDISVEPLDGVPTHSGQSILRGALDI